MAAYTELIIDQGSNYDLTLFVVDERSNTSANLSNCIVRSSLRKNYQSANSYASFTAAITNGSEGIVTLSLDAASTSAIKAGRYVYDVEVVDITGRVTRLLEGTATITPEVTR